MGNIQNKMPTIQLNMSQFINNQQNIENIQQESQLKENQKENKENHIRGKDQLELNMFPTKTETKPETQNSIKDLYWIHLVKEARIHELLREGEEFKADEMDESFQSEISPHNNMKVNNAYFDS